MTRSICMQVLPGAWLALVVLLAWGAPGIAAERCDAVPAQYAALANPEPPLEKRRLRYWRKQFKAKCARCHGAAGDGGGEEAGRQAAPPVAFTDAAFMDNCTDGQLFYQIAFGGEDKSAMPAFGPESDQGWSEQKVWQMVAFIRRFAE